ncbi:DUF4349 domain-containing protein [Neisseria sp. Dent CA1/247]|uniref:DUF4349 domain-containing protein n=1 Tax=Neisseria sp. Dent CA1/247 TaxID=2912675 RepID=UPI001FCFC6C0|nr:DUF4349 domain-containing protein [Neisseria sp. Dent CA1/247]UOO76814.1 DUF4349 domain-containing protein [Neisseria sp. Dent CA1/247]
MNTRRLAYISLLGSLLLTACGGSENNSHFSSDAQAPAAAVAETSSDQKAAELTPSAVVEQKIEGRQLAVTADIDFQTADTRKTATDIEALTAKHGGFVASNTINADVRSTDSFPQTDGTLLEISRYTYRADLVVRIPTDKASEFLRDIQTHITFLNNQHFSAEDVSLDLRRQALEALRQQQLADQLADVKQSSEPSDKKDSAQVTRWQFDAKAQKEYAELEKAYWQDKVDFATIQLHFNQPETVIRRSRPNPETLAKQSEPSFFEQILPMLEKGWYLFQNILLVIVAGWPLWLLVALIWFGRRLWARNKSSSEEKEENDNQE